MGASPRPVITDKSRQPASLRVARFGSSPGATPGMLLRVQKVSQGPPTFSAPTTSIKGIQASSSTNLKGNPVHRPENPTGSTYSSTTGLSPLKQRERQAEFPSSDKTRPEPDPADSRGAPPSPQDPSPLRGTTKHNPTPRTKPRAQPGNKAESPAEAAREHSR